MPIDVKGINRKRLVIELARALPGPEFSEEEASKALDEPEVLELSSKGSVWLCGRKVYAMQKGDELDSETYDWKAKSPGLAASVVEGLR